jgi:type I restriction enzyme R subunit
VVNLLNKLDSGGFYAQTDVDAVVTAVQSNTASQRELLSAIQPISNRLVRRHKEAKLGVTRAEQSGADDTTARLELDSLEQMRRDMQIYVRLYTFMAQMLDFGNPEFHKRMMFFRLLLPLLDFERTHTQVDMSYVTLTSYNLRKLNEAQLVLEGSDGEIQPVSSVGTGQTHDPEKLRLAEIIRMVNDLFKGDLTDGDMLTYVNDVLKRKLLESDVLRQQALQNSREQFANSPDLQQQLFDAVIAAMSAHESMSRQAINDKSVLDGVLRILLGPVGLYEALRRPPEDLPHA